MMDEMRPRNTLLEILNSCVEVEEKAAIIYEEMADLSGPDEVGDFWKEMSGGEKVHMKLWTILVGLAEKDALPQMFDNPEETSDELDELKDKIDDLWKRFERTPNVQNMFILAYRLEFLMLYPAFEILFNYVNMVSWEDEDPVENYRRHIYKFSETLGKYSTVTPEMELLSDTLKDLWLENMRLSQLSVTDYLTGLLNRRGFFNTAKPLLFLAQRGNNDVGVLMADIDDFKHVNDILGHEKGDRVLYQIARIIKDSIRASDIAGRYGGEEFIVFLSTVERDSITVVAEKIRERVQQQTAGDADVTISIGIALGALGNNVEDGLRVLVSRADHYLYQAKKQGKNQVCIDGERVHVAGSTL